MKRNYVLFITLNRSYIRVDLRLSECRKFVSRHASQRHFLTASLNALKEVDRSVDKGVHLGDNSPNDWLINCHLHESMPLFRQQIVNTTATSIFPLRRMTIVNVTHLEQFCAKNNATFIDRRAAELPRAHYY